MLPSRKSSRLPGYDYAQPGAYFVTACAHQRRNIFGSIELGNLTQSPLGSLAEDCWRDVPRHYSNVTLDAWVCMPNHFHGVLLVHRPPREAKLRAAGPLGSVVGGFKAAVTRRARELGLWNSPLWQARYYDHVIRHVRALERVREYIVNNPAQWALDRENPQRTGMSGFYGWIEEYGRRLHCLSEEGKELG